MQTPPLLALLSFLVSAPIATPAPGRVEALSLDQAFAMAERLHPQLAESRALLDAAASRARAAGAFPNPELLLGAQQLPTSGGASNQKEYAAGIAQTIPLGQRLAKARDTENLAREAQARALEVTRRDLRKRVHAAFATALYQESAARLQTEITQSVEKSAAAAKARVDAGDAAPEDLTRLEIELARAKIESQRSQTFLRQSLLRLADALGDPSLQIKSLTGDLDAAWDIPALETLAASLSSHPEISLAQTSLRAASARIDLAKAERIPDIKVEALYHRLEGPRENTFDIGLSIPLPLFNRNNSRVRLARSEMEATSARARLTANELELRLRESHAQLTAALDYARALKLVILPRAEQLLLSAERRYAAGDTNIAELLAIRRDWAALQLTHLESLREVMQSWVQVSSFIQTR